MTYGFFGDVVVIRVYFPSREGERREHKGDALYLSYLSKTFLILILMFYLGGHSCFFFLFSQVLVSGSLYV